MPFSLLPTMQTESIVELTPQRLAQRGIKLLMLDFDNTIRPYTTDRPTEEMAAWLQEMVTSEIALCVVSNSHRDRVKIFCKQYGIDCVTHAKKPFGKGIRACLSRYGLKAADCAIAGDQIFTDTLGGNCAGVQTILVTPICNHNFWLRARHALEQPFIYAARKRRV